MSLVVRPSLTNANCEDDRYFRADFFDGRFDRQSACAHVAMKVAPISIGAIFLSRARSRKDSWWGDWGLRLSMMRTGRRERIGAPIARGRARLAPGSQPPGRY